MICFRFWADEYYAEYNETLYGYDDLLLDLPSACTYKNEPIDFKRLVIFNFVAMYALPLIVSQLSFGLKILNVFHDIINFRNNSAFSAIWKKRHNYSTKFSAEKMKNY